MKIEIYRPIERLKDLLRSGWIGNVPLSAIESVADHSFGVGVLAYLFALLEDSLRLEANMQTLQQSPSELCVAGLFHDIAESQYMDLDKSFTELIPDADLVKVRLDKAGTERFVSNWKKIFSGFSEEFSKLNEFGLPNESKLFVECVDKIELHWQALTYIDKGFINPKRAEPFLKSTFQAIHSMSKRFLFIDKLQEKGLIVKITSI